MKVAPQTDMKSLKALMTGFAIGLFALSAYALSEPLPAPPAGSVFSFKTTLEIQVEAPLAELFKAYDNADLDAQKPSVKGSISYFDSHSGRTVKIPAKFQVKGYSSANECEFKKLELKFKKEDTVQTVFENLKSIDLNTHCSEKVTADNPYSQSFFNHREVVIYKMAKLLGLATYEVRPLLVKFKNTGTPADKSAKKYQAFFVEDKSAFLRRLNAQEFMGKNDRSYGKLAKKPQDPKDDAKYFIHDIRQHREVDLEDLYRLLLFNVLIQNTDWGLPLNEGVHSYLWNVKVIALSPDRWVPLTHDFNFSGAVTGAHSNPQFIDSYKLADEPTIARIEASFFAKRAELYQMIDLLSNDPPGQQYLKKCLDEFFAGNTGRVSRRF